MSWYKEEWTEIIETNNITKKLLYEDVSYEAAISNGIAQIADTDIFKYKK